MLGHKLTKMDMVDEFDGIRATKPLGLLLNKTKYIPNVIAK